jgi:hypothetical protein
MRRCRRRDSRCRPPARLRSLSHVLHVDGGGSVLRAPGGSVGLDRHPGGGGPRFDQFERCVRASVGGTAACPGRRPRGRWEASSRRQGCCRAATGSGCGCRAPAARVPAWLSARRGGRDLTGDNGRVRPPRSASVVDATYLGSMFNATAMGCRPDLPLLPRSRQRSRRFAGRAGTRRRADRSGLRTSRSRCRSAARSTPAVESAAGVLVPPADPLHHAVDGDERGGRQLYGRGSLLVG